MSRKLINWIFWVSFLTLLGFVILTKGKKFDLVDLEMFLWILGVFLIPAIFYILARWIFPGIFPYRIRIRPFILLHVDGTYNGLAVSKYLEQEMQAPIPTKEARSRGVQFEQKGRSVNISVAGTTIPLEVIWGRIDRWVFGPICKIDGIVSEKEGTVKIEAWSSEINFRWKAMSSSLKESDPLLTAVRNLTDQIRESFGHYQELTDKFESQHRYESAIHYCQRLDNAEIRETTLAGLYYSAGRMFDAKMIYQYLLQTGKDEKTSFDVLRQLSLIEAAQGNYSGAFEILDTIPENNNFDSLLDKATIHCYKVNFVAAIENLQEFINFVERNLSDILLTERSGLTAASVETVMEELSNNNWIKVYTYLWDLSDAYNLLGRCFEELNNRESADENYLSSVEVLNQLSSIHKPYHQIALNLGGLYEDLDQNDEAIKFYRYCIQEASLNYPEDPEEIYALTNLAWATTGVLSCINKKLNIAYEDFTIEDPEKSFGLINNIEQLAYLLQEVPEEMWQSIIFEAINQSQRTEEYKEENINAIEPLPKEDIKALLGILNDIYVLVGEIEIYRIIDLAGWTLQKIHTDQLAQKYFWQLAQQQETCHFAEANFGLACVDSICSRNQTALVFLKEAIIHAPEYRNRAILDTDLKPLKDDETYKQLVNWEFMDHYNR